MRKFLALALMMTAFASQARAEELMNLFPKGRSAYQQDFDRAAEAYQVRAQSFVDDMYMYGGERNLTEEPSLLSHEDLAGIDATPDNLLDPSSSQLLTEDVSAEPPASPE